MPPPITANQALRPTPGDIAQTAERLLHRIRNDLLELDPRFDVDSDLFGAGLDSMAIMQVLLVVEEEFGVQLPDSVIKRETFTTVRRIAETALVTSSSNG